MTDVGTHIDVQLVDGPLPPAEAAPSRGGGLCTFTGITRPELHAEHGQLQSLDYDAYRPMAKRTMETLAAEASGRWPCHRIVMHHAVGDVPVGTASVFISVDSDHRADAFAACRWLIDTLKEQVPIWKRERWADGTTWVEGAPVAPGTT